MVTGIVDIGPIRDGAGVPTVGGMKLRLAVVLGFLGLVRPVLSIVGAFDAGLLGKPAGPLLTAVVWVGVAVLRKVPPPARRSCPDELRRAVRLVATGAALLSPAVARRVMDAAVGAGPGGVDVAPLAGLTGRQRDVLVELAGGFSNDEIAGRLHLSRATVRTYVSRLLAKLHARDRAQLVVLAYRTGLVRPG